MRTILYAGNRNTLIPTDLFKMATFNFGRDFPPKCGDRGAVFCPLLSGLLPCVLAAARPADTCVKGRLIAEQASVIQGKTAFAPLNLRFGALLSVMVSSRPG